MSPQQHKTEHATVTVFLSPLHVHSVIARDFRHNIAPCWLIRWKILQDVLLVATVDWFQMYNFDNLNKTYDLLFHKSWFFCLSKDYVESYLLKYIHFCHSFPNQTLNEKEKKNIRQMASSLKKQKQKTK